MFYIKGTIFGITATGKKPEPGKGILNTAAISVKIDPLAEWPQIFDEAWRVNRDYFYDPGMHGVDWNAMKTKYSKFLPDLACRSDLNRVIQWMCSELGVGHTVYQSPETGLIILKKSAEDCLEQIIHYPATGTRLTKYMVD